MKLFLTFLLIWHSIALSAQDASKMTQAELLQEETEKLKALYEQYAKFYDMPVGAEMLDITHDVLISSVVKEAQKKSIRENNRRIVLFTYPSDGFQVKGLISFVPNPEDQNTLVFLRGGNRIFGIQNPGSDIMCAGQYTVITTTYRGSVGEGEDEFGGNDVNDVKNLIDYIPQLEKKLSININQDKMFLLGGSRGGMQMFLALARFPELQKRFVKIVSLSGLLDIRSCIINRPDMLEMFITTFGLKRYIVDDDWLNRRDILLVVDQIDKQVPILIIQGTKDIRVSLQEGYNMLEKLQSAGHNVTYWEIDGGDHCLANIKDRVERIMHWLEEPSAKDF